MADYELVLTHSDGVSERFLVPEEGLRIGRSKESDVVLSDELTSRRHARLWLEEGTLHIEDLGSRNGIEINGVRQSKSVLGQGDTVRVGATTFRVIQSGGSNIGRSVLSEENARALHESIVSEGGDSRLRVLFRAAKLLGTVFDLNVLLNEILVLIFEAVPVRRGFVIILSRETGEPEIHASRSLEEGDQGPPLSRTLIRHVFDQKSSMLTTDAQDDSRFDQAASIFGHEIHSAMCAPLPGREDVVGAIYVDSGTTPRPFTSDDLGLLTAIALNVGVAVENARLYRENVEQERLAAIGLATAGLGHCVKNILTGIRGGSEFINMALQEENFKYLRTGWPIMSRAIDRIEGLVMNMLTFSRDRKPERALSDVAMLIRDVFQGLQHRAGQAHVVLEAEDLESGRINIDAQQIFRVIQNLALNAIEACETAGGRVTAKCSYEEDGCTFSISDTGVGIAPELMPKLAQAFVSTKGSSGTGLGLACSYKIVHEHGGTVDVESEEGHGAQFTVFLPYPEEDGGLTIRGDS